MKKLPIWDKKMEVAAYTLVDDDVFIWAKKFRWRLNHKYVSRTSVDENRKKREVLLHREIMSPMAKGYNTDHINRNTLDNRRKNLRVVSRSGNNLNSKIPKNNSSGYKGVQLVGNRWRAAIGYKGGRKYLGRFDNAEEAYQAYVEAAKDLHGYDPVTNTVVDKKSLQPRKK
jgi:hypothetical protein